MNSSKYVSTLRVFKDTGAEISSHDFEKGPSSPVWMVYVKGFGLRITDGDMNIGCYALLQRVISFDSLSFALYLRFG